MHHRCRTTDRDYSAKSNPVQVSFAYIYVHVGAKWMLHRGESVNGMQSRGTSVRETYASRSNHVGRSYSHLFAILFSPECLQSLTLLSTIGLWFFLILFQYRFSVEICQNSVFYLIRYSNINSG